VHPGHPFIFRIAATGDRPMTFSVDGLPSGLSLDPASGVITGTAPQAGDFTVTLHATNSLGTMARHLLVKVGDTIALTPPMGWNSWNCFAGAVTDPKIRSAADAMENSGLADHGWTFINVDDYWQVNPEKGKKDPTLAGMERNPDGSINPNPRFPDMKGLADYIHSKGLKAGLYSSPGPYTCGGCTGSYQHEDQDAQSYATWGFDYLKYDWCSYDQIYRQEGSKGLAGEKKPYQTMAAALAKTSRDIVFSFCQYGRADVWKWGAETGGNLWRTTGDINDSWNSMLANASRQIDIGQYAGPGHWNDPDMLIVGKVGWGPNPHPTSLTADEQYTHISLWCLQAAPLLIGCDLTQLDPFTLGLLTNDEVIDVDQDPLGQPAQMIPQAYPYRGAGEPSTGDHGEVWARPLADGSIAVGLFNLGPNTSHLSVAWSELNLTGAHAVRDLWRQKDLGSFDKEFGGDVPSHGVLFIRVGK
jgi:alpha-galactosidase